MTDKNTQIEVHTYNWGPCLIKVNILEDFRNILTKDAIIIPNRPIIKKEPSLVRSRLVV